MKKIRPGKSVSRFELQLAKGRSWGKLMEHARWLARHRGERVRVVATLDRYGRWTYVAECASYCRCRGEW